MHLLFARVHNDEGGECDVSEIPVAGSINLDAFLLKFMTSLYGLFTK
jgi:hypothetical protein